MLLHWWLCQMDAHWFSSPPPPVVQHLSNDVCLENTTKPHHNRFTVLFLGTPGWCQEKTSGLMVQREINRGIHTDHLTGCHSIFFYRPDALPAPQPTVSKHWRQLCLENNEKDYQNHSVLYCVRQLYTVTHTYTHEQFSKLTVGLGFI